MTIAKSIGAVDTAVSGVSSLVFPRGILNFGEDYREKSQTSGKELILTNITAPFDQPEKVRICYSDVANIFAGTGVDPTLYTTNRKGMSILAQLTNVIKVTDSADPAYREYLPCSYHLVYKGPISSYITADDVLSGLGRLLSCIFDTGSLTSARLNAILRGSLTPSDL